VNLIKKEFEILFRTYANQILLRIQDSIKNYPNAGGDIEIMKDIDTLIYREKTKAQIEAIEQCAVEAGERGLKGESSGTMLGDMWDARIAELRAAVKRHKYL